jgi:RimJ/RimL family protein N-acetyltransferase
MAHVTGDVQLREVKESDLPVFYEDQADPDASRMAAVASRDEEAFTEHWRKILADESSLIRTILFDGQVAGNVLSFERDGLREVGYWISRDHWGKGIATEALDAFLVEDTTRPIYARVASDNFGSVRVLEKSGFQVLRSEWVSDETRHEQFEELLLARER